MQNPKQIVLVAVLSVMLPAAVAAQNRERFGISAKAGGVNAVVGRVMVTRKDQEPQLLSQTENISAAETVSTGTASNAEILLNPGSYLRLDENSEFKFEDISLDSLQLRLVRGSAIIEATGVADMNLGIKIATPHAEFTIMRSGVYRLNVQSDASEMAVRKGRASFGPNKTDIVKGGNTITIGKGFSAQGKLAKEKDTFEAWSKQRAEFLAKANERLSARALNGYLSNFNAWDPWFWGRNRFGLWTFSSRFGCYTFLPFYYGWSSPYGHWYGNFYWRGDYFANPIFVNNQIPRGTGGSGSSSGGGTVTGSGGGSVTPGGVFGGGGVTPTPVRERDSDSNGVRGRSINRPVP
jgi:FecR-like protein